MKLFHRMMILTLILCLVFGLGGCTQEKSPSEPEQSSMQTVEPPEEPGTEPLTFESADLGISFDLPDSLRGHSKIMVGDRDAGEHQVDTVTVYYMESPERQEKDIHLLTVELWPAGAWDDSQSTGTPIGESADGRTAVLHTLQSNPFSEGDEEYELFQTLGSEIGVVSETFAFTNVG